LIEVDLNYSGKKSEGLILFKDQYPWRTSISGWGDLFLCSRLIPTSSLDEGFSRDWETVLVGMGRYQLRSILGSITDPVPDSRPGENCPRKNNNLSEYIKVILAVFDPSIILD